MTNSAFGLQELREFGANRGESWNTVPPAISRLGNHLADLRARLPHLLGHLRLRGVLKSAGNWIVKSQELRENLTTHFAGSAGWERHQDCRQGIDAKQVGWFGRDIDDGAVRDGG